MIPLSLRSICCYISILSSVTWLLVLIYKCIIFHFLDVSKVCFTFHLGCSHVLLSMDTATKSIHGQVLVWTKGWENFFNSLKKTSYLYSFGSGFPGEKFILNASLLIPFNISKERWFLKNNPGKSNLNCSKIAQKYYQCIRQHLIN